MVFREGKKIIPGSRAERGVGLLEGAWSIVGKARLIFCFPTDLVATHLKFPMTPGWPWTSPLENSPVKHPRRAKCHISSSENDGNFFSSSRLKPETRIQRPHYCLLKKRGSNLFTCLRRMLCEPSVSLCLRQCYCCPSQHDGEQNFHPNCATVCDSGNTGTTGSSSGSLLIKLTMFCCTWNILISSAWIATTYAVAWLAFIMLES